MEHIWHPIGDSYSFKGKTIKRPEQKSGSMPQLVKDEMCEGAEGKDKEPAFAMALIEIEPSQGNQDEKEKGMAKYPAMAEGPFEEEQSYGFINNVREKRAYQKEPYIYVTSQGSKP